MNNDIKSKVFTWGIRLGRKEAEKRLSLASVSWSLGSKLLAGLYKSKLGKQTETKIKKAMTTKGRSK